MATKIRDIESAARSTLDNDPVFQSLISMYASKLGTDMESLDAALNQKAWSEVKDIAHRLKGTAAMYGFTTLSELFAACERAETDAKSYETARESLEIARTISGKLSLNYPS